MSDNNARSRRGDRRPIIDIEGVAKLFSEPLPHSIEAEMSLLGSILLDPLVIADVEGAGCCKEAFYSEAHAVIYEAMLSLPQAHRGDTVRIMEMLKDARVLDAVGGAAYLVQLAESVPYSLHAAHYAEIVVGHWKRRRLVDASSETIYEVFHEYKGGPEGAKALLDKAEARLFSISDETEKHEAAKSLGEMLHDAIDAIDARSTSARKPVLTGFYDFDRMTGGLDGGEMVVLAARPSMGKTALALNILERIATGVHMGKDTQPPLPTLLFSLEMNKSAIAARFVSGHARVSLQTWKRGMLSQAEWRRVIDANEGMAKLPLYCDDSATLTITQLRSRARRMVSQNKIRLIAVDYLQLMSAPNAYESRQVEVSATSRGIKALARELDIPIIVMAQLNRQVEQRESKRPRMSDLRESGSVEQDADMIALLHREEYYHQDDEEWLRKHPEHLGKAELIIAKQRNGPTGVVHLDWDAAATRFSDDSGVRERASPPPGKDAPRRHEQKELIHDAPDDDELPPY